MLSNSVLLGSEDDNSQPSWRTIPTISKFIILNLRFDNARLYSVS